MASLPTQTTASLYVGDLDANVAEAQLYDLFSQVGPVASIRVCRDSVSRRSLCYAYVNFNISADASRAMESLNHTPLNGKPIRIMLSHRDPSTRKSGVGNLFVKNLHESVGNKELQEIFSPIGKILSCKVAMQDGKSKGYGFVHFDTDEAANAAIEKTNGTLINGKKVYVGKFVKRSERASSGVELKFTNLYVKNIDLEVTEEDLQEKFSKYGKITNLIIMKDEDGNPKGFGFINFESPEDARKAVDAMNGTVLGSKAIFVGRAQKKAEREQMLRRQFEEKRQEKIQKYQGANVYVKNLDDLVDDDYLRKHFSVHGNIVSAKVMRNEKGISKGFGFICFSSTEEATKAVSEHGTMLFGKPIYVAIAQRKEVRRAQLEQQYAQRMAALAGPPGPMVPAPYPPMYFTAPPGVVPPLPQRQGIMYPVGLRPGWRPAGVPPPRPGFQSMPTLPVVPAGPRQQRQIRGRANGQVHPQAGPVPMVMPLSQQQPQPQPQPQQPVSFKDATRNQQQRPQRPAKYVMNGRGREMTVSNSQPAGLGALSSPSASGASGQSTNPAELSSLLANALPQQQKQMLGERLFPLVQQLQFNLAGKITGMLLEMDNSELLLLLESPESLASKVDEAVQVLQQHMKVGPEAQDPLTQIAGQQVAVG
ncbi:hypothetical protein KP509_29G016700 [Ceratopteris richardii]|uniref:Polyadenylate-binding protein n=1 Tax=Ceratopteris richardii TaxID=49495 RepID=A0A8T2R609_CERRI|nr:hypothetical protein KP509_29G016700 [Ceratopteris richardii]